jgi:DNA-binding MarR family transcriptional regulator
VVFRAYVLATHAAVADLPGGARGYQVLSAAAHGMVDSQLALAQRLGVDRTVMTYLLDDLEKAGLIVRRPSPVDRRARHIVATKKGTQLLVTLDDRLRDREERLLAPLDDEARETFRSHISLLAAGVSVLDPLDNPCDLT